MRRAGIFGLAVFVACVLSCGDGKPVPPGQDLVGSWTFQNSDFSSTAATNLQNHLLDRGLEPAVVQQLVAEFKNEMDRGFRQTGLEIVRFNEDRTFEDNSGNSGIWSVLGDVLTVVQDDGLTIQCQYFVDGEDLTLILNKDRYLNVIRQTEGAVELDADTLALLNILFGDGDSLRLFYKAR